MASHIHLLHPLFLRLSPTSATPHTTLSSSFVYPLHSAFSTLGSMCEHLRWAIHSYLGEILDMIAYTMIHCANIPSSPNDSLSLCCGVFTTAFIRSFYSGSVFSTTRKCVAPALYLCYLLLRGLGGDILSNADAAYALQLKRLLLLLRHTREKDNDAIVVGHAAAALALVESALTALVDTSTVVRSMS